MKILNTLILIVFTTALSMTSINVMADKGHDDKYGQSQGKTKSYHGDKKDSDHDDDDDKDNKER